MVFFLLRNFPPYVLLGNNNDWILKGDKRSGHSSGEGSSLLLSFFNWGFLVEGRDTVRFGLGEGVGYISKLCI